MIVLRCDTVRQEDNSTQVVSHLITFCPLRLDTGLEPLDLEAISFSDPVSSGTPAAELPNCLQSCDRQHRGAATAKQTVGCINGC